MNRKNLVKINLAVLCTLFTLAAFGMHEGEAGPAPKEAITMPAREATAAPHSAAAHAPDVAPFILVSSDGQEIPIPTSIVTDTFHGKPLSPVLNAVFTRGPKEQTERKAKSEFPADILRFFVESLSIMHEFAAKGKNFSDPILIEQLDSSLQPLKSAKPGTYASVYAQLLEIANYYQVPFLIKEIGYALAHDPAIIENFITRPTSYKNAFEHITEKIPTTIGSGNWIIAQTLAWHTDIVYSVAFSPDGQQLANGSYDRAIKIWTKQADGHYALAQTLEGPKHGIWSEVLSVAFSPDGKQLASGSFGSNIKIWTKQTDSSFNLSQTLEGHEDTVHSVAFSPDGKQLASGSDDHTIKIWTKQADEYYALAQTLEGYEGDVYSVAFSPDGQQLASGSFNSNIKIWTKQKDGYYALAQTLEGHTDIVYSVAFSPDNQQLANGSYNDRTIKIWTKQTDSSFNLSQTLEGHEDTVYSVAFSPDNQQLASGSRDNTIKIWTKQADGRYALAQTLEGHAFSVHSVAFSPNGQQLASGSDDNTIKIWNKDLKTVEVSLLQALLLGAIKQAPGTLLDILADTESNRILQEIAHGFIGTLAEKYVRDHVKMDWPAAASAAGPASAAAH